MIRGGLFVGTLLSVTLVGGLALRRAEPTVTHAVWLVIGAMVISFLLTPVVRWIAGRLGAIDRPGGRKVHERPTPLLGGTAIYIGFMVAVVASGAMSSEGRILLLCGSTIFVVGAIEDIRGVPALVRLVVQIGSVVILIRAGIVITFFPPPGGASPPSGRSRCCGLWA